MQNQQLLYPIVFCTLPTPLSQYRELGTLQIAFQPSCIRARLSQSRTVSGLRAIEVDTMTDSCSSAEYDTLLEFLYMTELDAMDGSCLYVSANMASDSRDLLEN